MNRRLREIADIATYLAINEDSKTYIGQVVFSFVSIPTAILARRRRRARVRATNSQIFLARSNLSRLTFASSRPDCDLLDRVRLNENSRAR